MTKKDFVIAWLLASRASGEDSPAIEEQVARAEWWWDALESRYKEEE